MPGAFSQFHVDFDGSNDHVVVGDVAPLQKTRTSTFSFGCWFRFVTLGLRVLLSKLDNTAPNPGYEVGFTSTGEVFFQLVNAVTTDHMRVDTVRNNLNDGGWHHLVVTWDGDVAGGTAGATIYLDNIELTVANGGLTATTNTLTGSGATTTPFQVGARDGANLPFLGDIDDPFVYNIELTPAQVSTIYNAGDPPDLTVVGPTANLDWGLLMGDGDTFPTLQDITAGGNDGTMTNMVAGDIVSPGGGTQIDTEFNQPAVGDFETMGVGTGAGFEVDQPAVGDFEEMGGGGLIIDFKMRGRDSGRPPGSDYITWISTGSPDFAGAGYATGTPTPIGALIAGSVVKVAELTGQ